LGEEGRRQEAADWLREERRRRLIGVGEEAASCALLLCTVEVSSSFLFLSARLLPFLNDAALHQY
jgi:hypothetical protein